MGGAISGGCSVAGLLVVDDSPEGFGVQNANVALLDFHDAVFHKFGERSAHRFQLETQVAADFLSCHSQHQL